MHTPVRVGDPSFANDWKPAFRAVMLTDSLLTQRSGFPMRTTFHLALCLCLATVPTVSAESIDSERVGSGKLLTLKRSAYM